MHYELLDLFYLGETVGEFLIVVLKLHEVGVTRVLHHVVVSVDAQGLRDVLGFLLRRRLVEHQVKDVLRFIPRFVLELRLQGHETLTFQGQHNEVSEFR